MQLVVDSSVVVKGDWHLQTAAAQALTGASRLGQVKLLVPEVVVREVVAKYAERERDTISKLSNTHSALQRLQGPLLGVDSPGPTILPQSDRYDEHLRKLLRHARIRILPMPEVSHDELVTRALDRRPPFDKEGRKGYRDALIWHTVLGVGSATEATLLISEDDDFAENSDSGRLHSELRKDVRERQLPEAAVGLCRSFDEAVRLVLVPAREVLERLRARLREDEEWSLALESDLERLAEWAGPEVDLAGVEFTTSAGSIDGVVVGAQSERIEPVGHVSVQDAYALSEDRFIVRLDQSATALYRLDVTSASYLPDGRLPPAHTFPIDQPELPGHIDVELHFSAHYDARTDELSDLDLFGATPV